MEGRLQMPPMWDVLHAFLRSPPQLPLLEAEVQLPSDARLCFEDISMHKGQAEASIA